MRPIGEIAWEVLPSVAVAAANYFSERRTKGLAEECAHLRQAIKDEREFARNAPEAMYRDDRGSLHSCFVHNEIAVYIKQDASARVEIVDRDPNIQVISGIQ